MFEYIRPRVKNHKMFKKLKDKIAEEVKSSPQRIQQLTQSVTERIQNATSDESFFSIGDDDAPSSSPNPEPGFSNVSLSSYSTPNSGRARRNSNSSVASDISFLPRYESATNLYHLQSDLDVSASEVEDNASTSSQLGHLSKEQIYAAFQKAQMRYHKYRGRYTDIANHYRELERENGKMKSVLVETQDKALRRVAELREQCSLEQKAKAHLENALRVELDEKQYVIDTLKTKINLLQASIRNDQGKSELLVNVSDNSFSISDDSGEKPPNDNLEILTKDLKDARIEIENLNGKIQEMKANAIVFGSKEADLKKKISDLEEVIRQKTHENSQILERERENNLIIAQTKMELHTEIQNRDLEIENLKYDIETLKADLDQYENQPKSAKMENLQSQNTKLIEKVEELTHKCNNYESELLKTEQLRIEIQNLNKIIESFKVRTQELEEEKTVLEKTLLEKEKLEEKLLEFESIKSKGENLQTEVSKLKEIVATHEKTSEENAGLREQLKRQQAEYDAKIETYREDTKQQLLTLETKIRDKVRVEYEKKQEKLSLDFQEKLQQLSKTDNNIKETQLKLMEKEEQVKSLDEKLKILEETLEKHVEKYKDLEANHLELISESADVRNKFSNVEKENSELNSAIANVKKEILEFEGNVSRQQSEICALQNEKTSLQQQYEILAGKNVQILEDNKTLQCENERLRSENTSLQSENLNSASRSDYTNLQRENARLQAEIGNLQMEISQLENESTTLRNKNAALSSDSNKLTNDNAELTNVNSQLASDNTKLREENAKLASNNSQFTVDNAKLIRDSEQLAQDNANLTSENSKLRSDCSDLRKEKTELESRISSFEEINSSLEQRLTEATKASETFQKEISEKLGEILSLRQKLADSESLIREKSSYSQAEIASLQAKLAQTQMELINTKQTLEDTQETLESTQKTLDSTKQAFHKKLKDQKSKFHSEVQNLNKEILSFKEKNEMIQGCIEEYKQKLAEYETESLEKSARLQDLTNGNSALTQELHNLKKLLEASKGENSDLSENLKRSQDEVSQKIGEIQNIHEEKANLNLKLQNVLDENNNLREEISRIQADSSKNVAEVMSSNEMLQQRLQSYESDFKTASAENEKLKGQVSRLHEVEVQLSDLRLLEDDYKKLQEQKLQLMSDVEELQTRMQELSSENQRLHEEISRSQDQERVHNEILRENQETKEICTRVLDEIAELKRRNNELSLDYDQISHENESLLQELAEIKLKYETLDAEKTKWDELAGNAQIEKSELLKELQECKAEIEKLKLEKSQSKEPQDTEKLENENKSLKVQLRSLEEHCETCKKQKKALEGQLRELEHQYSEIAHEKQLLQDEVQELKISPINMNHSNNGEKLDNLDMIHAEKIYSLEKPSDVKKLQEDHEKEINHLNEKLIQYKSLDLTNRSSIQFYESELQRLKNKNEKLNRKLDETLVTLNHCAELSTSTVTEYLRNVLYNYMLGKEGLVLARVIAAVCKFDENQTEAILQREQQKQTLLGQLGFL